MVTDRNGNDRIVDCLRGIRNDLANLSDQITALGADVRETKGHVAKLVVSSLMRSDSHSRTEAPLCQNSETPEK